MIAYIILAYLCYKCDAPLWCHILMPIVAIAKTIQLGYKIKENE